MANSIAFLKDKLKDLAPDGWNGNEKFYEGETFYLAYEESTPGIVCNMAMEAKEKVSYTELYEYFTRFLVLFIPIYNKRFAKIMEKRYDYISYDGQVLRIDMYLNKGE